MDLMCMHVGFVRCASNLQRTVGNLRSCSVCVCSEAAIIMFALRDYGNNRQIEVHNSNNKSSSYTGHSSRLITRVPAASPLSEPASPANPALR